MQGKRKETNCVLYKQTLKKDTKKVHSIMKKPVGSIQGESDIG